MPKTSLPRKRPSVLPLLRARKPVQPAGAVLSPDPTRPTPNTSNPSSDPLSVLYLRVPWSVKREARLAARAQGLSVSEYVTVCLEQVLSTPAPAPSLLRRTSDRVLSWLTVVRF